MGSLSAGGARIVLGLGSSHSPHVSTAADLWHLHAERDRENPMLDFEALVQAAPPGLAAQLTPEVFAAKHDACQAAIDELARTLAAVAPDVVVVVGDDQHELFLDDCLPALAIFQGEEIRDLPPDDPWESQPSIAAAAWARHAPEGETYPTHAAFGTHLVGTLSCAGFDVARFSRQPEGRSLGHAFTFVRIRLMKERLLPMVPIFVNCYYPPNQPTPERCYAFGRALRGAIEAWDEELRVAIVASGGLTHFVIDEAMDRQIIRGLEEKRPELLTSLPVERLVSGTSEVRNWIVAAGALEALPMELVHYTPAYRSPAGTGCGMAFARWSA